MGPIPKELNLERLIGQQLLQICLGAHEFQLRFESGDWISCEGNVAVKLGNTWHHIFTDEGWKDSSALSQIVGREVVSWLVESSHVLSITLVPRATIRLTGEDSPYESFGFYPEAIVW